jgi:hypothetical protein
MVVLMQASFFSSETAAQASYDMLQRTNEFRSQSAGPEKSAFFRGLHGSEDISANLVQNVRGYHTANHCGQLHGLRLANDPAASVIHTDEQHHHHSSEVRKDNCMLETAQVKSSTIFLHKELPAVVPDFERGGNHSTNGQEYVGASCLAAGFSNFPGDTASDTRLRVDNCSGSCTGGSGADPAYPDDEMRIAVCSVADRCLSKQYHGPGGQTSGQGPQGQINSFKVNSQANGMACLSPVYSHSCPDLLPDRASMCYNV